MTEYLVSMPIRCGQDFLDISAFGITSGANFAARVAITDEGADTLVTIDGSAGQTIRLVGINDATTVTQGRLPAFVTGRPPPRAIVAATIALLHLVFSGRPAIQAGFEVLARANKRLLKYEFTASTSSQIGIPKWASSSVLANPSGAAIDLIPDNTFYQTAGSQR